MPDTDRIHRDVAGYYSDKLREHGASARGVDWNSEESQTLRFSQLLRVADRAKSFSLIEIGCGYGGLVDYLKEDGRPFTYLGLDLSEAMIDAARRRFSTGSGLPDGLAFAVGSEPDAPADFAVASGIYNVKFANTDDEWVDYVKASLDVLDRYSLRGFSFNMLTTYSDKEKMRANLFYASPEEIFGLCKRKYSRQVALLHDYGLYEFTILVRKDV